MVAARNELFGISISVSDDDFATMIMGSLPPSYRQLLSNVSAAAKMAGTKVKPNDLIKFINEEVEFRARDSIGGPGESALYASNTKSKTGKDKSRSEKSKVKGNCRNCDRPGHYERDCWRPGGGKEGQGPKQKRRRLHFRLCCSRRHPFHPPRTSWSHSRQRRELPLLSRQI